MNYVRVSYVKHNKIITPKIDLIICKFSLIKNNFKKKLLMVNKTKSFKIV